jgi:hypothetical protein
MTRSLEELGGGGQGEWHVSEGLEDGSQGADPPTLLLSSEKAGRNHLNE